MQNRGKKLGWVPITKERFGSFNNFLQIRKTERERERERETLTNRYHNGYLGCQGAGEDISQEFPRRVDLTALMFCLSSFI
jgi:hypothetical protein